MKWFMKISKQYPKLSDAMLIPKRETIFMGAVENPKKESMKRFIFFRRVHLDFPCFLVSLFDIITAGFSPIQRQNICRLRFFPFFRRGCRYFLSAGQCGPS